MLGQPRRPVASSRWPATLGNSRIPSDGSRCRVRPAPAVLRDPRSTPAAVYFPSCVVAYSETGRQDEPVARRPAATSRDGPVSSSGPAGGRPRDVLRHGVLIQGVLDRAYTDAVNHAVDRMWTWSDGGRLPVVVDTSPCAHTLKQARPDGLAEVNRDRFDELRILDGIEFAHDHLLPRLETGGPAGRGRAPPGLLGGQDEPRRETRGGCAARRRSGDPDRAGCCGFAGDRGFAVPELTAAATRYEAIEVRSRSYAGYYCSSRTCEIGLTRATGKPYRSFWHLLDETTR